MKTIYTALPIMLSTSLAYANCQDHWDARGLGDEMRVFCSTVQEINRDGLVVVLKKKPKGCSPSGPTSDCNPVSSILEGEGIYNGLMWFSGDGGFGFEMHDRQDQDGRLVGDDGGEPMYYQDLEGLIKSGAVVMREVDDSEEWYTPDDGSSSKLREFNDKLVQQNPWIKKSLESGTSVIFIQQGE